MKKIYSKLSTRSNTRPKDKKTIIVRLLSLWYWFISYFTSTPGLFIYRIVYLMAIRSILLRREFSELKNILRFPMDSVRHFEFDFLYNSISGRKLGYYLDLSSPRLIIGILIDKFPYTFSVIANPDEKDLSITKKLIYEINSAARCKYISKIVDDINMPANSFDTITSLSVIEHIPGNGDLAAVRKLWEVLKPKGRLYISVPCAKEAFEEYIDFNEYGLQVPDKNGFIFGQRFYDKALLDERIFLVTGQPLNYQIYGEKIPEAFIKNRNDKLSSSCYSFWREPYMMGLRYKYFSSIDELPGWGVIAMEFEKN